MKINGVLIFRISDLKNNFDFSQFYNSRKELIDIVRRRGTEIFFDTPEEISIYSKIIRPWIEIGKVNNSLSNYRIHDEQIVISPNESYFISENLYQSYLSMINAGIEEDTAIGVASLFKIIDREISKADISVISLSIRPNKPFSVNNTYIPLVRDTDFGSIPLSFPIEAKPIVNMSDKKITVQCGGRKIILSANECVVGVFHDGNCCRFLDNKGGRKTQLSIIFDKKTATTKLKVIKGGAVSQIIDNVISFYIDDASDDEDVFVYVQSSGEFEIFPKNHLFPLKHKIGNISFSLDEKLIEISCINTNYRLLTNLKKY